MNENDNNKNRSYPEIDKRIKDTYVKESTAQKTKVYDMYARFYRWASDRLFEDGVLCFVTNRSFIESRTFDGFRRTVSKEFDDIYVMDLGGDVRANPKLSGTKNNVFGIQTGVAIAFLVRRKETKEKSAAIYYARRGELDTAGEKLQFLSQVELKHLIESGQMEHISPDKDHNWINQADTDFEELIPVASKETKLAKSKEGEKAVFKLFSNGVNTARDDWAYDYSANDLKSKVAFFLNEYEKLIETKSTEDPVIKLSRDLKNKVKRGQKDKTNKPVPFSYRPFTKAFSTINDILLDVPSENPSYFSSENRAITFNGSGIDIRFLSTDSIPDWHFCGDTKCLPLYRYDEKGNRHDNITDWGLRQFHDHYGDPAITKEDLFHYTYAVLHDPVYREKYELNLKREFPRLPFYPDFRQWATWGKTLMDLHIGYEQVKPTPLKREDSPMDRAPKAKLKPLRPEGQIILDEQTTLSGIPPKAWDYKLGNRSALDWILDQYKEKTPKDPTIREKFNTYRFADYKDKVIDLLQRVTTVSLQTVEITEAMAALDRGNPATKSATTKK